MSITVRSATERDLERIAMIKVRSWAETYGPLLPAQVLLPFLDLDSQVEYVRTAFGAKGSILLVAETSKGEVVGFSLTFLDRDPEPWLESIHIAEEIRGHGVGSILMRETGKRVRAAGHRSMRLGVVEGNVAAGRFYARLGAISIGAEPVSWSEGVRVMHTLYRWPELDPLC